MDAVFSPEPLLDFCMHYMRDYRAPALLPISIWQNPGKIGEDAGY